MSTAESTGAIGRGQGTAFEGFHDACFAAYEEKKWGSNAFTLERRRAKDALLALASTVRRMLASELANFEMGVSDETPNVANARKVVAQWVYFTRTAEERASLKPLLSRTDLQAGASLFDISIQHQHACLALRIDLNGFTVGVELARKARVDRDNACEKLKNEWAKKRFLELASALPATTMAGFEAQRLPLEALLPEHLDTWVKAFKDADTPFAIEVTIPRGDPLLTTSTLVDTAADYVRRFLPVHLFLNWSKDNDHMLVKEAIQKEVAVDKKRRAPLFEPGERVTILAGLFAGRGGYLAEIDAKGKAKVMVGPVSVSVDVKDLKSG